MKRLLEDSKFELFSVSKGQGRSENLILSYEALGSKNPSIIMKDMEILKIGQFGLC